MHLLCTNLFSKEDICSGLFGGDALPCESSVNREKTDLHIRIGRIS